MSTEKANKDSVIVWQKDKDQGGVGEPALFISAYPDVVCIHQETNYINMNYDSLEEIIKVLRRMKKDRKD